ncbi:MAG TPA: hypothetical protein VGF26_00875 [Ramlibacter sp.]
MQLRTLMAIGCTAVTLIACGGGGGGGSDFGLATPGGSTTTTPGDGGTPTASTSVPASAFQSVDSFIAFVRGLGSDETSEPLTLPAGAAPTSDTTEPAA